MGVQATQMFGNAGGSIFPGGISLGPFPRASAGLIRFGHAANLMAVRNFGDTADQSLLTIDVADELTWGGIFRTQANGSPKTILPLAAYDRNVTLGNSGAGQVFAGVFVDGATGVVVNTQQPITLFTHSLRLLGFYPNPGSVTTVYSLIAADAGRLVLRAGNALTDVELRNDLTPRTWQPAGANVIALGSVSQPWAALWLTPSALAGAALNVGTGVTPTAPVDGDIWITATQCFAQIGGSSIDLGAGGSSGISLQNGGVPLAGGPFTTLNGIGGGFADLGGGAASYTPPGGGGITGTLTAPIFPYATGAGTVADSAMEYIAGVFPTVRPTANNAVLLGGTAFRWRELNIQGTMTAVDWFFNLTNGGILSVGFVDKIRFGNQCSLGTLEMVPDTHFVASATFGAIPASAGALRLSNATAIVARDAGNAGDITLGTVTAGNLVSFGNGNWNIDVYNTASWYPTVDATRDIGVTATNRVRDLFLAGVINQDGADGAAAATAALTNAPTANTVQYVPFKFNGAAGWLPFVPA